MIDPLEPISECGASITKVKSKQVDGGGRTGLAIKLYGQRSKQSSIVISE